MGFIPAKIDLARYALPFSTQGQAWDRQTDGRTTAINTLCPTLWGGA